MRRMRVHGAGPAVKTGQTGRGKVWVWMRGEEEMGGVMLLPEDVTDCLAMLGQCTELEGPGGQEAMIRMWST